MAEPSKPAASQSPFSGHYVSNEVIALQLGHLTEEIKMLRSEMLRADVYRREREADQQHVENLRKEVERLESDARRSENRRWGVYVAVGMSVLALGKELILGILQAGGAG